MKKQALMLSLLLSVQIFNAAPLESEVLLVIDGTILAWDSVGTIKKYQHQIKHFLNTLRSSGSEKVKLFDLALKERKETLTDFERSLFEGIIQEFASFSEPFLDTLNPVKQGIAPVIQEFCTKRNRTTSVLLVWLDAVNGAEEVMFRAHVKTYRAVCELCMDLLNFTDDLLNSCPKAVASFHDFFDRVKRIEPFVDALLVADHIKISRNGVLYHELIRYIAERYTEHEEVTVEKTTRLYNAYNVKKRL